MRMRLVLYVLIFILIISSKYTVAQEIKQGVGSFKDLMVSENYGSIRDSYFSGNDKGIVVHIQDLHCNYDAQMSIYHMIDELIDKYGLNLVTVEGSVGKLETAPISKWPDDEIKEEMAKYFVKIGEADGVAFAHIMRKSGFVFWGVDNKDIYKQNVEAYKVSLDTKANNTKYYENIKSILKQFKAKVYSPELKELDEKIDAYKGEKIDFSQYVSYLASLLDKRNLDKKAYPNFTKLTDVFREEAKINFVEVDTQRSEYIDKLNKELDKDSLSELLDKSLYFKMGKLSAVEFYTYLEGVASSKNVTPLNNYPQLAKYIEYIKLYSAIDNIALFKEIDAIEKALKEKFFTSDIQRKVDTLSYTLGVLNDLFGLKLTTETLQYYRDHRKEFATSYFINFISENTQQYGIKYTLDPAFRNIDATLPSLEKFYQLAQERDGILVDNTVDKMKQENAKIAVLVSGGFHTDGITKLLKEKQLSYVVITPKVNSLGDDNLYPSVLLGKKSEFDRFFDMIDEVKNKK